MARTPIHPGEVLRDELVELDMTAESLARKLRVDADYITAILNGSQAITAETALRLGHFFGTGPELWINLQKQYELRLAEQNVGEEILETIVPLAIA